MPAQVAVTVRAAGAEPWLNGGRAAGTAGADTTAADAARLLAFVSGLPGLASGSCRSRLAGAGQLVWRAGGRVSRGQVGETAAEPRRVGKV